MSGGSSEDGLTNVLEDGVEEFVVVARHPSQIPGVPRSAALGEKIVCADVQPQPLEVNVRIMLALTGVLLPPGGLVPFPAVS